MSSVARGCLVCCCRVFVGALLVVCCLSGDSCDTVARSLTCLLALIRSVNTNSNPLVAMFARAALMGGRARAVLSRATSATPARALFGTVVPVKNPHLGDLDSDYLYHLGLSSHDNIQEMFNDVKFLCVGGSAERIQHFATRVINELGPGGKNLIDVPNYVQKVYPLGKTERYSLYVVCRPSQQAGCFVTVPSAWAWALLWGCDLLGVFSAGD